MQKRYTVLAALLCATSVGLAEEEVHTLQDISVKGEAVSEQQQAASISSFKSDEIEKMYLQRPEEILREVPGAEPGDYNQGGVANTFMMRGFGGGGHAGDAAIFVDGIPLNETGSHGGGYADMNVMIPLEIDQLDIFKGPGSALYGNFARGGTVAFTTKKGGEYNKLRMEYGSYNSLNTQGSFGMKLNDKVFNNTAIQFVNTEGYQENSNWMRGNFATRFGFQPTERLDFAISARAHGSEWGAPGYIQEEQFKDEEKRFDQAPTGENDGGMKEFYTERFDLGFTFTDQLKLLYWAYGTQQDFTRYAKFYYTEDGQTEQNYDRSVFGTGLSINYKGAAGNLPLGVVAGAEYYGELCDINRWNTKERVRGTHTEDKTTDSKTISEFAQVDLEVNRFFRPLLGIRFDHFLGDLEERIIEGKNKPADKSMNELTVISPKAGFATQIIDPLTFRFNYSKGFQLPKPEYMFNSDYSSLEAVALNQFEASLKYELRDIIAAEVTGFILDTDGEIQETVVGSGTYENLGKTRRSGIEFGASIAPVEGVEIYGNLSGFATEVLENTDKEMVGKEVKNVPQSIANVGVRYTAPMGLGGGLSFRNVGEYYIDSQNSSTYEGYKVLNGELFYTINGENDNKYRLFFSVKNIADEAYSQSAWVEKGEINYAVGSPRTFSGGVQLDW
jgi:iron complex outermembrane receptor protein